jgi:CBS domain-containing protein
MALVKDIMTAEVLTVTPGTAVNQAARLMLERRFNALPVVDDDGALVGIITQSDLISLQKDLHIPSYFTFLDGLIPLASPRHFEKELERVTAAQVGQAMTPSPVTVAPTATVGEAAALMVERNYHTLLVGVLGKEDVLRTLLS